MEVIHKEPIGQVHFQHKVWMNHLTFYKEELVIFQKRLEEVDSKNTSKEVHKLIDEFQNQFLFCRNKIEKLRQVMDSVEKEAVKTGKFHMRRIDYEATDQFINIKNDMAEFEKSYKVLKENFYNVLSKWM
jgi:hypothetical protein